MFFKVYKYLQFIFSANSPKGNGIHPHIVRNLVSENFIFHRILYESKITGLRKRISNDKTLIDNIRYGAPSKTRNKKMIPVSETMKITGISHKLGVLLFNLVNNFKPETILELGTGIGISTIYLALGNPQANVITIEGSREKSDYARNILLQEGISNVQFYTGSFDEILPIKLRDIVHPLLVFIDGNHRFEPTIEYFNSLMKYVNESTIIIFDDIHWSREMERAWKYISANENVRLSIDIFRAGIVFFNKELPKQHILIKY